MPSDPQVASLLVQIDASEDADAEELDDLTRELLSEVRELDVESAELQSAGVAPAGTKSAEALSLGGIVVAVLPPLASKLIDHLYSWVARRQSTKVKLTVQENGRALEIEFSQERMPSEAELKHLVDTLTAALAPKEAD